MRVPAASSGVSMFFLSTYVFFCQAHPDMPPYLTSLRIARLAGTFIEQFAFSKASPLAQPLLLLVCSRPMAAPIKRDFPDAPYLPSVTVQAGFRKPNAANLPAQVSVRDVIRTQPPLDIPQVHIPGVDTAIDSTMDTLTQLAISAEKKGGSKAGTAKANPAASSSVAAVKAAGASGAGASSYTTEVTKPWRDYGSKDICPNWCARDT